MTRRGQGQCGQRDCEGGPRGTGSRWQTRIDRSKTRPRLRDIKERSKIISESYQIFLDYEKYVFFCTIALAVFLSIIFYGRLRAPEPHMKNCETRERVTLKQEIWKKYSDAF